MSLDENQNEDSLLDTIFEGRNKSYGAYELRQNKSKRTVFALLVASTLFISLVMTVFLTMKGKKTEETKVTKVELKKVAKPKDKKPVEPKKVEEKKEEVQKKVKSVVDVVKNVPPRVVKERTVEKEISNKDFENKKTDAEDAKGDPTKSLEKEVQAANEDVQGDTTDYSQVFNSVEVNPEPPGGIAAFRKKIGDTFRLPEVEETLTGTVIGRFVVDENGSISDIKILKETPANLGLANEYKRVLAKMPKWKPGVMNGRNVKVYYTLPIQIQITASE